MDYSQVCQGWIYYIRNKVNGKMYIGKTNNYEKRRYQHFNLPKNKFSILAKAFNKYGKDNFEMCPIVTFQAINNDILNHVLSWLETYYIKKYNTLEHGYNMTKGGEGTSGYSHREETKLKIRNSAFGRKFSEAHIEHLKLSHLGNEVLYSEKAILQYNKNGEFIKEFKSVAFATRELLHNNTSNAIYSALHCNCLGAGYLWRYKTREPYPLQITPYINPHSKRGKTVYHYTQDGKLINEYKSPKEASILTNIPLKRISLSLNRAPNRKRRKDFWSYNKINGDA